MTLVVKSASGVSLATQFPDNNHRIGPFGAFGGCVGETIDFGDFCTVMSDGSVMRALEDQTGTTAAVNDVQTMSCNQPSGNILGTSTYVLGFRGVYTAPLAPANTSGDVQTAMQGLSSVGAGNMTVSGAFPNFVFTAASGLAGQELELIEVDSSLLDSTDPQPAVLSMVHTTVGQPVGASGAEQSASRVRGIAVIKTKRGEPITLYDAVIMSYSDDLLTPGADLYLSGTVPGGLDTAPTLTGQKPIAFAMDTQRIYVYAIR